MPSNPRKPSWSSLKLQGLMFNQLTGRQKLNRKEFDPTWQAQCLQIPGWRTDRRSAFKSRMWNGMCFLSVLPRLSCLGSWKVIILSCHSSIFIELFSNSHPAITMPSVLSFHLDISYFLVYSMTGWLVARRLSSKIRVDEE